MFPKNQFLYIHNSHKILVLFNFKLIICSKNNDSMNGVIMN